MSLPRALMDLFARAVSGPIASSRAPRPAAEQARVDAWTVRLVLYHFEACPHCHRVRRSMEAMGLDIARRDVRKDPEAARQLLEGGGKGQVPCLRIAQEDGTVRWMYESGDIIAWLARHVDSPAASR